MTEYYNTLDEINKRTYNYYKRAREYTDVFVETGCDVGLSLKHTRDLGFTSRFSCDIDENDVKKCKEENLGEIYLLDSVEFLKIIVPKLTKPAFFWLDAHEGQNAPVFEELEVIKTSPIKNHVIMIDDLPIYFEAPYDGLKRAIQLINPDYKFELCHTRWEDYALFAYIN